MTNNIKKMKESLRVGALLSATTGFIDSHTFFFYNGRLASFQSGNILQFGICLARGNFKHALIFIWPILAFLFGSMLNQIIKRIKYINILQWEEFSIIFEVVGITLTTILEIFNTSSILILSLLAISMAIQTSTFTKLHGFPYVTTLFTGNIKLLGITLTNYILDHQKSEIIKALNISLIIFSFLTGVILATFIGMKFKEWSLIIPILSLFIIWFIIAKDR